MAKQPKQPSIESESTRAGSYEHADNAMQLIEPSQAEPSQASRSFCSRWFGPLGEGSQRASVLALAATAFGSGLLALPWVFSQLGLILGFVLLVASGLVSLLSQRLLANAAYATGLSSYASITQKTLGCRISCALDVIIFVYAFGSVCGYFVFIGQFGPQLCASLKIPDFFSSADSGPAHIILVLAIFPSTPVCLLRSLASLRYATLGSIFSLLVVAALIIVAMPSQHIQLMEHEGSEYTNLWWMQPHITDWKQFPAAMAICFYSFCCHVNLFAKYRELDSPTSSRVRKVLVRSVMLEVIVYSLIGAAGFLSLGPSCTVSVPTAAWPSCAPMNILASPRFSGAVGVVARICMILTLLVCIPLNVAAARDIVEQRIIASQTGQSAIAPSPEASPSTSAANVESSAAFAERPRLPLAAHLTLSLAILYVAAGLAIVYPKLNAILSILGGFCAVTFMLSIPIGASFQLYFGQVETSQGVRHGVIGRRRSAETDQIGTFWGVTKRGTIGAAVIVSVCIGLGYLSAVLALINMVTGKA